MDLALGDDLRSFIDASPSPSHAVAEAARRLAAAGFSQLSERDEWSLAPGDQRFVVRDGSSIVAFRVGAAPPAETGVVMVGTHTDSPTFKVRAEPERRRDRYRLMAVEPYGGALRHTWLDRDLTVAGRVVGDDGSVHLVRLPGAPVRLTSLAIHLDRGANDSFTANPQTQLVPIWDSAGAGAAGGAAGPAGGAAGPAGGAAGPLDAVAEAAGVDQVAGHDLVLADVVPAARAGADDSWVAAPRLDNLGSTHSALRALIDAAPAKHTQLFVGNDHEEVGSVSHEGARGTFLSDTVTRLVRATGDASPQAVLRCLASSRLLSADMAHALHPNYPEKHDATAPALGGGPVLKLNANQSYTTDAVGAAWFRRSCAAAGVPVQTFLSRSDLPCGSTIGPFTAAKLGIATVDVGSPMLAMHSCRELASALDVPLMVAAMTACLTGAAE